MVFAPRQNDNRRYFQMSGAWFLFLGILVAVAAIVVSTGTASRVFGVAFGCVLVARGVFRLRDARAMGQARDGAESVDAREAK